MPQESQILVILFADISGSTNLYETLGDESAHKLVSSCISLISEVVVQHQGTIIKTIGDEVMSTFAGADHAVYAATGMQKAIDTMPPILPGQRIRPNIRVGLHMGPVIRQGNDIFGDAVNVAARMVALAKPRQIITTQQTVYALPKGTGVDIKCIDRTTIKGRGGEFIIYEIIWEEETLTIVLSEDLSAKPHMRSLYLRLGDKEVCVDSNNPSVTMGRQEQNDFVVDDAAASRMHARIEYFRGKFVLIDQSTNGTYIFSDTQKPVLVHNDEVLLKESGFISMGREAGAQGSEVIHFRCEDRQ
jgi:adenylate cyclase